MKQDHERVTKLLTDTVSLLCKNGLSFDRELRIQGLLGITVDNNDVFLVSINDCFDGCTSDSTTTTTAASSAQNSPSPAGSDRTSRKRRSCDDIVDLTRLVETPDVRARVRQTPLPSTATLAQQHCGPNAARPKSAGSANQTPPMSLPNWTQSQRTPRQPTHASASGPRCGNAAAPSSMSASRPSEWHSNALALVPARRGPPVNHAESFQHLMMAQAAQPRVQQPGQCYRQAPADAGPTWTAADQQRIQQQRMRQQHMQNMATRGSMAPPNVALSVRSGPEQCSMPLQRLPTHNIPPQHEAFMPRPDRHHPTALCPQEGTAGHYFVSRPPPRLSRVPPPEIMSNSHSNQRFITDVQQLRCGLTPVQQLIECTERFQLPAKRHVPGPDHLSNSSISQGMQDPRCAAASHQFSSLHAAHQIPPLASISQMGNPPIAFSHALPTSPPTSAAHPASNVQSAAPIVKPPSSPIQSGRRSRPRPTVDHIDLCAEDELSDSGRAVPTPSIVIQPDNIDSAPVPDEANMLSTCNTATDEMPDFSAEQLHLVPENSLPSPSRIHEIVPLDDGMDDSNSDRVAAQASQEDTAPPSGIEFSAQSLGTGELSDGAQNSGSDEHELLNGPQLSTVEDYSHDDFPMDQLCVDTDLTTLSADESRQLAELYFDVEDSDMHTQS